MILIYYVLERKLFSFACMERIKSHTNLKIHAVEVSYHLLLPYADAGIRAGFPSPAQDYMDIAIDLNRELIQHPAATFYGRVVGDSMRDEGIQEGDILIIDKSLEVQEGDLVVCCVDGDFTLKRIHIEKEVIWLVPSNTDFPPIKIIPDNDFIVWGVVTYTIKKNRKRRR